jgi:dihydrofolate synthase/folylpolyglutamate synthase
VARPLATVITPVALDHQQYLGDTLGQIATEKAGILKAGSAAIIARQDDAALAVIEARARELGVTPIVAGRDFDAFAQNGRMVYQDGDGLLDLPAPRLIGAHQIENAGLAIATVRHAGLDIGEAQIASGLKTVQWPARLQSLTGRLLRHLAPDQELWLDGGHNPHGAAALARALAEMDRQRPAPLVLVMGMMNTRDPAEYLAMFEGRIAELFAIAIPGEANSHNPDAIVEAAAGLAISAEADADLDEALARAATVAEARIVICGSLYLAGHALSLNGTPPQ